MIGSAIGIARTLIGVTKLFYPEDKDIATASNTLERGENVYNLLRTNSAQVSGNRSVIAPMVVVENNLIHQEWMRDLLTIVQLRDVASILSHLAYQGTAGSVKIGTLINSINPNRAGSESLAFYEGLESYQSRNNAQQRPAENNSVTVGNRTYTDLVEYTPLALGKVVEASVSNNGEVARFPLVFRQTCIPDSVEDIKNVFSAARPEDGFLARLLMFKTKEITGPELLTGKDEIKRRFKLHDKDMAGYYTEAESRASKNRKEALKTGIVSVNTLANAFIMSLDTQKKIELEIGRAFDSRKSLVEIFKVVKANTIVVCDDGRGVFVFYTLGSTMPETFTRSELKTKANKNMNDSDLTSLLKLLNMGA